MCCEKSVKCRTRVGSRPVVYDHVDLFMIWRYLSAIFHIINNLSPVMYVDTRELPHWPALVLTSNPGDRATPSAECLHLPEALT